MLNLRKPSGAKRKADRYICKIEYLGAVDKALKCCLIIALLQKGSLKINK